MIGGMKVKTSVTLSRELLDAIEQTVGQSASRSEFLERVAWKALREQWRRERDERDIAIYESLPQSFFDEAKEAAELFGVDPMTLGDEFSEDDFVHQPR
jgi:metal-responsive CopG/Arc/MetJ family transcriptional regulator